MEGQFVFILFDVNLRPSKSLCKSPPKSHNQKERGQANMKDEAVFPNRSPQRDLSSIELFEVEHSRDGE